jgi:hypothetical protein
MNLSHSLLAPEAKALAQSRGLSIEVMLGPNANTARFKRHQFKFIDNQALLLTEWEG